MKVESIGSLRSGPSGTEGDCSIGSGVWSSAGNQIFVMRGKMRSKKVDVGRSLLEECRTCCMLDDEASSRAEIVLEKTVDYAEKSLMELIC